eukprot:9095900-Alexandrium_andersonii.AAC.1
MARKEGNRIGSLGSIHNRGIAGKVLEDREVVAEAPDLVAPQHHPTLDLTERVALIEPGILFDADLEYPADMSMAALTGDTPLFNL